MEKFFCKKVSLRPWFIIGIFLFFWCVGIVFLSGVMEGVVEVTTRLPDIPLLSGSQEIGLVIFLFTSLALGFIFKKSSTSNQCYEIDQTGILFKVGHLDDKISFQEIESIEKVSNDQARALALDFYEKENKEEKDPTGNTYSMDELVCYSIAPFTVAYKKVIGSPARIDIKAQGDFLLMTLKNGKKFLLSPDEKEIFLERYNQMKG